MSRLANKTVLITGASAGIGTACARLFAAQGSNLILTARRQERLENLKSELLTQYPKLWVECCKLDVRDRNGCTNLLQNLKNTSNFSKLDILINNAGLVLGLDPVEKVDKDEIDIMFDTNVKGLLYATQACLPLLKESPSAHIVNIGSIAGKEAYLGGSIYCASKFAVDAITKTLRHELASSSVRVTSINPGMVETEFSEVRFHGDKERAKNVYKGIDPLTAETVVFVTSRPHHVEIADIIIFPHGQSAATSVYRKSE